MSLLNDALKRASRRDRARQPSVPARVLVEPAADPRGKLLALALGAGSAVTLVLAVWFFWQLWTTRHQPVLAKVEAVPVVTPKLAPPPVNRVESSPPPVAKASPPRVAAATPVPAHTPTPAPAPAAPPVPAAPARMVDPAWPAELKVTGIFIRKSNPLALISGKTVGEGDEIKGIRVTKIEDDRVTVEWNGQVKELTVNVRGY
jgi:hypothetical protein